MITKQEKAASLDSKMSSLQQTRPAMSLYETTPKDKTECDADEGGANTPPVFLLHTQNSVGGHLSVSESSQKHPNSEPPLSGGVWSPTTEGLHSPSNFFDIKEQRDNIIEALKLSPGIPEADFQPKPPMKLGCDRVPVKKKKLLVINLAGTLVHSRPQEVVGNRSVPAYVKFRPFAFEFIEEVARIYEIAIYECWNITTANIVSGMLDPGLKHIRYVLGKEHCTKIGKNHHLKDLRHFADWNLKDIVTVDNDARSFCSQISNGVPICRWRGQPEDQCLRGLANYLKEAAQAEDIRVFNEDMLGLKHLL